MKAKVAAIIAGVAVVGVGAVVGTGVARNIQKNKAVDEAVVEPEKKDDTETKVVIADTVETEVVTEDTEVIVMGTEEVIGTEVISETNLAMEDATEAVETDTAKADEEKDGDSPVSTDVKTGLDDATATGSTDLFAAATDPGEYVVFAKGVNVRATENGEIIGGYNTYQPVEVLEIDGKWGRVNYNGRTGWVFMTYFVTDSAYNQINALVLSGQSFYEPMQYRVISNGLYIRSDASQASEQIGELAQGQVVRVTEEDGNWGKIEVDGVEGWINMDYVTKK